jgi:hypothetical protein
MLGKAAQLFLEVAQQSAQSTRDKHELSILPGQRVTVILSVIIHTDET